MNQSTLVYREIPPSRIQNRPSIIKHNNQANISQSQSQLGLTQGNNQFNEIFNMHPTTHHNASFQFARLVLRATFSYPL